MVGKEWLVDACGCDAAFLCDADRVLAVCNRIISDLDLHVIGTPNVYQFPDTGGLTVFYVLTESHLACHTYPEKGVATFNLYCCRQRRDWDWRTQLTEALSARAVMVNQVTRGADGAGEVSNKNIA